MFTPFLLLKNNQTNIRPSEGTCVPCPAMRQQLRVFYKQFPKHPTTAIISAGWQLLVPVRPCWEHRAPKARPAFRLLC